MVLASEMDLEPEQYSSQLADIMLNHKLQARSDPQAASASRMQQNRHRGIFIQYFLAARVGQAGT